MKIIQINNITSDLYKQQFILSVYRRVSFIHSYFSLRIHITIQTMQGNQDQIQPARLSQIRKKLIHQPILLSRKIFKINRKNKAQQRCIVLTGCNLYNIQKTTIKRTIRIPCIEAISLSLSSNEMVLHVPSEYDYRYDCSYRDEFLKSILTAREVHIRIREDLMVFLIAEKELTEVTTTEDDVKKDKRRSPKERPKFVNLGNMPYVIYGEILRTKTEELLYICPDKHLNFKKPDLQKLVKIGVHSVCEAYIARDNLTKDKYNIREYRKNTLNISPEEFKKHIMQYQPNKFWVQLIYVIEKENYFELVCSSYRGDLYGQMNAITQLQQDIIKHIVIRLLLAIEYMPTAHKAITPQNILLDNDGNTYLSDFIRYLDCENPPQYLSPQQILQISTGQPPKHPRMINIWQVGVLAYEIAYGVPPFAGKEIIHTVFYEKEFNLRFPKYGAKSGEFRSFLGDILKKQPEDRLGWKDFSEIRNCRWLREVNWEAYRRSHVTVRKYFKNIQLEDNFAGEGNVEYIF